MLEQKKKQLPLLSTRLSVDDDHHQRRLYRYLQPVSAPGHPNCPCSSEPSPPTCRTRAPFRDFAVGAAVFPPLPTPGPFWPDSRRSGKGSRRWCCPPWSSPQRRTLSRIASPKRASACGRLSASRRLGRRDRLSQSGSRCPRCPPLSCGGRTCVTRGWRRTLSPPVKPATV